MTDTTTLEFPIDTLWVDSILTGSVDIDWSEALGEDAQGWRSYEAPSCPDCGEYAAWDSDDQTWRCRNDECERTEEIEPWMDDSLDGPMMNYFYPLPDLDRVGGPNEAAERIADLPLCVIDFDNGGYALALTGGGMDLSWEICEAFMRLGFLPPFRFCRDLPKMAGREARRDVLAASRRTMEVLRGWTISGLERLTTEYGA